jgi:hypothetical protein
MVGVEYVGHDVPVPDQQQVHEPQRQQQEEAAL